MEIIMYKSKGTAIYKYSAANSTPASLPKSKEKQYDETRRITAWLKRRQTDDSCMKNVKFIPKET